MQLSENLDVVRLPVLWLTLCWKNEKGIRIQKWLKLVGDFLMRSNLLLLFVIDIYKIYLKFINISLFRYNIYYNVAKGTMSADELSQSDQFLSFNRTIIWNPGFPTFIHIFVFLSVPVNDNETSNNTASVATITTTTVAQSSQDSLTSRTSPTLIASTGSSPNMQLSNIVEISSPLVTELNPKIEAVSRNRSIVSDITRVLLFLISFGKKNLI